MNELHCPKCRRFLGSVTTIIGRIQCPSCKAWTAFNVGGVDSQLSLAAQSVLR